MVVTMLDEVAWLFNLRGADIAYNPVFFAYATITPAQVTLFVNPNQLDDAARSSLGDQVVIRDYTTFFDDLKDLAKELNLEEGKHVNNNPFRRFFVQTHTSSRKYYLVTNLVLP